MTLSTAISQLDWTREPKGLYEPIAYAMASGGKRLRPQFVLLAAQIFDGQPEDAMPAALAVELFHNFTLLHDDVMDHASVRRGRPTVHIRWNDNTAILSGDQMLIEAYKQLGRLKSDCLPHVLRLFNRMATEVCEGQQYDVDYENKADTTLDDYLMMIRLKTSVLLATALQIGACIAGADDAMQQALYAFGIHIGLAFQIQDDVLDVYGDPATFGKAIGGDILCNKKTYVLLTALAMADAATRTELQALLAATTADPQAKIQAVTALYNRIGVRTVCEQAIEAYIAQALDDLKVLPDNAGTQALRELAQQLQNRKL